MNGKVAKRLRKEALLQCKIQTGKLGRATKSGRIQYMPGTWRRVYKELRNEYSSKGLKNGI